MDVRRLVVGTLKTNCYLLISGDEAAVIDPGGGADDILRELAKNSVKLVHIVNTHGHPDHILADTLLKKATGADILIHEAEKFLLRFTADRYLQENDIIKIGAERVKVVHTPGHTPGGICLLGENLIFTGDTLFKNGYGRTDLPGGSEEEMSTSLKRLAGIIRSGMTVYPGHGEIYRA
jgi:hydroxyacylglutathione hydrolase